MNVMKESENHLGVGLQKWIRQASKGLIASVVYLLTGILSGSKIAVRCF